MNWLRVGDLSTALVKAVFTRNPEMVKEVFERLAIEINLHDHPFTQPPLDYIATDNTKE